MPELPHEWFALLGLVFMLGAKHGFDADHLAAVDGLTRHNLCCSPARARWCGTLFSLGHGAVVILIALGVGMASAAWTVPAWLENLGTWISITVLFLLGAINLHAVLTAPAHQIVATVGLKAGWLRGLQATSHPLAVAGVGALFALSFDTVSQAVLFAATAGQHGGLAHLVALGVAFTLGMLVADGANGLWIARLLRRADQGARIASRVMGLMVAAISFAIAGFGLARWMNPGVAGWYEGRELHVAAGIVTTLLLAVALGRLLARDPTASAAKGA